VVDDDAFVYDGNEEKSLMRSSSVDGTGFEAMEIARKLRWIMVVRTMALNRRSIH